MKPRFPTLSVLLAATACADAPTATLSPGDIRLSVTAAATPSARCGEEIPVTVSATSQGGHPVSGVLLNLNVVDGGGRMYGGAAVTNKQGQARDFWTVGATANTRNTIAVRAVDPATGARVEYFTQSVTTVSKVAFSSTQGGATASIWTMNPDGSGARRLTDDGGNDRAPAWSADGSQIAFVSDRGGSPASIWIVNADGTGLRRVTNAAGMDAAPAWSPDGRRIVFSSDRQATNGGQTLWVVNSDGSGLTPLLDPSQGFDDRQPVWSPNGREIAFMRNGNSGGLIWIIESDGTNPRPITDGGGAATDPAWSPDGRQVAYRALRGAAVTWSIWVVDFYGYGALRLTDGGGNDAHPSWSPDGGEIVFASDRGGSSLWAMKADGSGAHSLASAPGGDPAPRWSGCTTP
jgi:TolB protein